MTPFEATYNKTQNAICGIRQKLSPCTLKQVIANKINSSWIYSSHWKDENYHWISQAKADVKTELKHAHDRLDELREAERFLNGIEDDT